MTLPTVHRALLLPILVIAGLAFSTRVPVAQHPAGTVQTATGLVAPATTTHPGVRVFKGIPFAAPPVGDLRWRAPQPPAAWAGVRPGDTFGNACMQDTARRRVPWTEEFMAQEGVSEDCLYLNVWTPQAPAGAKPVLVYLHGGAFREGSGAVSIYDGTTLASRGLVVVTINYRLGAFGFLAHPALASEGPAPIAGEYGVLDAIAALQWVQRNIAAFGGDPAKVTIAGQSAGASLVHSLISAPSAKGLFHRAIAQSGSGMANIPAVSIDDALKTGAKFGEALHATTAAALRAAPAADVLRTTIPGEALAFRPPVDGRVIVADQLTTFTKGLQNDVPLLTGLVADEGSSNPTYGKLTRDQFLEQARTRFIELADRFLALYPAGTDAEAATSQIAAARDRGVASMFLFAERRQKSTATHTPIYTYYFARGIPWPEYPQYAAFHSSDLAYTFGNLERMARPWTRLDRQLAEAAVTCWSQFVKTGTPAGADAPTWPAVDLATPRTMEFGEKTGPRPLMDAARLAFWRDYFASPQSARIGMF